MLTCSHTDEFAFVAPSLLGRAVDSPQALTVSCNVCSEAILIDELHSHVGAHSIVKLLQRGVIETGMNDDLLRAASGFIKAGVICDARDDETGVGVSRACHDPRLP